MDLFSASYKTIIPDTFNFGAGVRTVTLLDRVGGKVVIPGLSRKEASEVSTFVKELKPKKNKSYIHLISTGAMEWYGPNKWGDAFNEDAHILRPPEPIDKDHVEVQLNGGLKAFHNPTFMTNGKVYREHKTILDNVQPSGDVVLAIYNDVMHRGELIIELDNDLWKDDITALENGKPPYYSMGCLCDKEVCSICGNDVSPKSDKKCSHLRDNILSIDSKGNQVKAIVDKPIFYDISRVARPADKIAFAIAKVASEDYRVATKTPAVMSASLLDTLENRMRINRLDLITKVASEEKAITEDNQLPVELDSKEDEDVIKRIKQEDVPKVIFILKQHKAVLPPPTFIRMLGGEGQDVNDAMPMVGKNLPGIFESLMKSPEIRDFLEDGTYEGEECYDSDLTNTIMPLINKYSLEEEPVKKRVIRIVLRPANKTASEKKQGTPKAEYLASQLAKEYARYQLSFLTKNNDSRSIRLTLANNHANVTM